MADLNKNASSWDYIKAGAKDTAEDFGKFVTGNFDQMKGPVGPRTSKLLSGGNDASLSDAHDHLWSQDKE